MTTYGSICSGIEAATVAVEPLGWEALWFAEIDRFACAVLAHHYPTVPNLGDMTKIAALVAIGKVDAPDVLVGGTPCQAFSVAGLRAGLSDARGAITLAFVELANAIDTARSVRNEPACVVWWENVPGVLSSKDNAFGCFLAGLAGEDSELVAPGGKWPNAGVVVGPQRTIAWRVLDAQYFGVAQRRRRVFLIASARDGFDPAAVLFEWDGVRRDTPPRREAEKAVAALTSSGVGTCGADDNQAQAGHLLPIASTGDISHCLNAGGMGRQDYETETVIVQSVALRGREGGATAELGGDVATALRCGGGGGDKPHVLAPVPLLEVGKRTGASTTDIRAGIGIGEPGDTMYTLQAGAQHGVAVAFAENSRAELRLEGGDGQRTGALSTGGGKLGQGIPMLATAMAVRRLMPVECERLQSFPDNYTFIPTWNGWRKMDSSETPESCRAEGLEIKQNKKTGKWRVKDVDGPRYKAIGNSMCVYNMRWIGRRIDRALRSLAMAEAA